MSAIAIITARGGSKRLPRKNIRPFLGRPIISYGIEAAKDSGLFDEIMLSTDDPEIAAVGKGLDATIPFMRSAKTSDDFATTADVLEEVLQEYSKKGIAFQYGCCIYPTAAFVTAAKLKQAFQLLTEKNFVSVFPVVKYGTSILRSLKLEDGRIAMNFPEYEMMRSQDLSPAYYDCGQFYWFRVDAFLENKQLYTANSGAIITNEMEAQDIDNENDWKLAELKYKLLNGKD